MATQNCSANYDSKIYRIVGPPRSLIPKEYQQPYTLSQADILLTLLLVWLAHNHSIVIVTIIEVCFSQCAELKSKSALFLSIFLINIFILKLSQMNKRDWHPGSGLEDEGQFVAGACY